MTSSRPRLLLTLSGMSAALFLACPASAQLSDRDVVPTLLLDTVPGSGSGIVIPSDGRAPLITIERTVYFIGPGGLWESNGRAAGTRLIPSTDTISRDPVLMPGTDRILLFRQDGLYAVSPPSNTVSLLRTPAMPWGLARNVRSTPLTLIGGRALFLSGSQVWSTDGTPSGTVALTPASISGAYSPAAGLTRAYFLAAGAGTTKNLWRTDGTPGGTSLVANIGTPVNLGSNGSYAAVWASGDAAIFAKRPNTTGPYELWTSDGTGTGTRMVITLPGFSGVSAVSDSTGWYSALYTSQTGATGPELWHLSPDPAECRLIQAFPPATFLNLIGTANNFALFTAVTSWYQGTLWISDGTPSGSLAVPDFPGRGTGLTQGDWVIAGDRLIIPAAPFGLARNPWQVDLRAGSISVLRECAPEVGDSDPSRFFPLDHGAGQGFLAYDSLAHYGLFATTGTPQGTRLLSHLTDIPAHTNFTSVGSRILFLGGNIVTGTEPWIIDRCPADYDNSGSADIQDIFSFLRDWFAGDRNADFDNSGGPPALDDLFAFIRSWMEGCEE